MNSSLFFQFKPGCKKIASHGVIAHLVESPFFITLIVRQKNENEK